MPLVIVFLLTFTALSGCAGKPADGASKKEKTEAAGGASEEGETEAEGGAPDEGKPADGSGMPGEGKTEGGMPEGDNPAENGEAPEFPYTFTDSTGKEITLESRPQTVAVLFSSLTEIWQLAGGEAAVTVGESVERGFSDAEVLLVDSGAGKTIDNELLVSYRPDFVIGSADIEAHTETAKLLDEAGIPCALFQVDSFDDYLSMLKICTDITGNGDRYRENGLRVKERVDTVLSEITAQDERKRILFIRSGSSESSAKAKTAEQHFAARMLEELGVYNIADNAAVLLDGLSLEEILAEDPDYIFIAAMGDEEAAKAYMDGVLSRKAWQSLTAVKEKRYVYLPKELFQFKPNARWDEAYSYLAELLYPEMDSDE